MFQNVVNVETRVLELRLDHNFLHKIGGALNLHGLIRLNVSHNFIQQISPDDLMGLDKLRVLDISHNQVTTLEETSKVCLRPSQLVFLVASKKLSVTQNRIAHVVDHPYTYSRPKKDFL